MGKKIFLVVVAAAFLALIGRNVVLAEGQDMQQPVAAAVGDNQPSSQWVWGEVLSIDQPNRAIRLKYVDYDTDEEKELALVVDDSTTYENIKAFDAIVLKDTISVDYVVSSDGRNIAKNISAEKPEANNTETQGLNEGVTPQDLVPGGIGE